MKQYAYKPIRVILSGDRKLARGFVRQGQKQSAELDHSMSFQTLDQGVSEWMSDNREVTIKATTTMNERKIEIFHAPILSEKEVPVFDRTLPPDECGCVELLVACEIIGLSNSKGIFCGQGEYCQCYDVLTCVFGEYDEYSGVGLGDYAFSILWERVPTSDFTRYEVGDRAVLQGGDSMFGGITYGTDGLGNKRVWHNLFDNPAIYEKSYNANKRDPDHIDYCHPCIYPMVMSDAELKDLSYKPFFDHGIMKQLTEGKSYLINASLESGYFDDKVGPGGAFESLNVGKLALIGPSHGSFLGSYGFASGNFDGVVLTKPWKAQVVFPEISGDNSIYQDPDDGFFSAGDTIINSSAQLGSNTVYDDDLYGNSYRIAYRGHDYKDGDSLNDQLTGGSFAFNGGGGHIAPEFDFVCGMLYIGKNNEPMNYECVILNQYESSASGLNPIGKMSDGSVSGETVGRLVLRPATPFITSEEEQVIYGENELDVVKIYDYTTGQLSEHFYVESGGVITQVEEATLADMTLFNEMFPERPGILIETTKQIDITNNPSGLIDCTNGAVTLPDYGVEYSAALQCTFFDEIPSIDPSGYELCTHDDAATYGKLTDIETASITTVFHVVASYESSDYIAYIDNTSFQLKDNKFYVSTIVDRYDLAGTYKALTDSFIIPIIYQTEWFEDVTRNYETGENISSYSTTTPEANAYCYNNCSGYDGHTKDGSLLDGCTNPHTFIENCYSLSRSESIRGVMVYDFNASLIEESAFVHAFSRYTITKDEEEVYYEYSASGDPCVGSVDVIDVIDDHEKLTTEEDDLGAATPTFSIPTAHNQISFGNIVIIDSRVKRVLSDEYITSLEEADYDETILCFQVFPIRVGTYEDTTLNDGMVGSLSYDNMIEQQLHSDIFIPYDNSFEWVGKEAIDNGHTAYHVARLSIR